MSNKFWDACMVLGFFVVTTMAFFLGWITRETSLKVGDPERLWEGSAEWVAVDAIENDNIILKHKLDEMQAHYDSLICYRP